MKALAVSVVVLGALLFGAVVAYAGWGWNAKADIEGTTIGTAWSVANGGKAQYDAVITITVPANASVNVTEVASSETVTVVHTGDRCSVGTIDAVISYLITGDGNGDDVSVSVNEVGGAGVNFGSAEGKLGSTITVNASIPGECSG